MTTAKPPIDGGSVKGLAVFDNKRSSALPNVPTAAEQGVPNLIAYTAKKVPSSISCSALSVTVIVPPPVTLAQRKHDFANDQSSEACKDVNAAFGRSQSACRATLRY